MNFIGESRIVPASGTELGSWYQNMEVGDSSSPAIAIVGSTPVLIGTWHYADTTTQTWATAPNVAGNLAAINSVLGPDYPLTVFGG